MIIKDRNAPRIAVHPELGETSRAKPSFKDDCDINLIVKRHASTGMWEHLAQTQPTYGDNSAAVDLGTAFQAVKDAEAAFLQLPAEVRAVVNHDPVLFLEALSDEMGFELMVEAGLPVPDDVRKDIEARQARSEESEGNTSPQETDPVGDGQ